MLDDAELLHRHAQHRDKHAFAELVARELNLVHSAALRETGGEKIPQAGMSETSTGRFVVRSRCFHPGGAEWSGWRT
jgi:hypothetical protein